MKYLEERTEMIYILFRRVVTIIIFVIAIVVFLCRCGTTTATRYKIVTLDRNYYTNGYSVSKDSIYFFERGRGHQKLLIKNCEVK